MCTAACIDALAQVLKEGSGTVLLQAIVTIEMLAHTGLFINSRKPQFVCVCVFACE